MGRPRKAAAAPAPAPVAEAPPVESNAIFFDDGDSASPDISQESAGDEGNGEGEYPRANTPVPVAQVATTATAAPQPDLSIFLKEMQLLRESLHSQRAQLELLQNQRAREQQEQRAQMEQLELQRQRENQDAREASLRVQALELQLLEARQMLVQAQTTPLPPPPVVAPTPITTTAPAFRTTAPSLPRQQPVTTVTPTSTTSDTSPSNPSHVHARLGLTGDLPNTSKRHQTHMSELKLGSRYVIKGSNGLT